MQLDQLLGECEPEANALAVFRRPAAFFGERGADLGQAEFVDAAAIVGDAEPKAAVFQLAGANVDLLPGLAMPDGVGEQVPEYMLDF